MKRPALAALLITSSVIAWKMWPESGATEKKPAVPESAANQMSRAERPAAGASSFVTTENKELTATLRPDILWQRPAEEPEFADFNQWAAEFVDGQRSVEEGVKLARERRAALVDLISRDPRRALELAVPESVRRTLPPAVLAELEERVSGRGDLLVAAAAAMPGWEHAVTPVSRTVTIRGREYEAFTYGNRESAMSRRGLAIHGIALDGKLALSEWPARILEPVEVEDARVKLPSPPLCPVSAKASDAGGDEVVLDWSLERAHWYCQAGHAMQELRAAAAAEAALPPGGAAGGTGSGGAELPVQPGDYTEGTKSMLFIRVDFPDKPGQVVSDATLTNLIDGMADHWTTMSGGRLNWKRAGEGSRFTPTLRLPGSHASYRSLNLMLTAARAAAEDAGFDYRDYNFEIVVTGDKPDVSFGGIAYVGERGAWLANGQWNLGMCSHELGHNLGLNHSGFWQTTDGTPHGAGSNAEYGNPFDHMGGASSSTGAHFNARQKHFLRWLPESSVRRISADGMVSQRLFAFDRHNASGTRVIAVDRSGTAQDYWIEYRSLYPSNPWLRDGVLINFGDANLNNARPALLDFTPRTSTREDCALLTGRTFSDVEHGIHITPTGRGEDAEGVPYLDVTVQRGVFDGNRRPSATLSFSPENPSVNAGVSFTLAASDPDGDALSCFWDWGDGTFSANNAMTNAHSWTTAGIRTVRCTVSDMKGGTTTASALVQTGLGSTYFLSGMVRAPAGAPVEGVTVSAGGRSDVTDSEGFYAVTGLSAGSYTVTAAKAGFVFTASGFSNPVSLGPSASHVDFTAPPGVPVFGSMKPALVDAGSSTGPVPLPLRDGDTPVTALTLAAVSSHPTIVPHSHIAFGTSDPPAITVSAPVGAVGAVAISITATGPEGGRSTCVWPVTVNGPPRHVIGALSPPQNTPLDIDLSTLVSDDITPADRLAFRVGHTRNGSVQLLSDGRTARFTPAAGFNGPAEFTLVSRDCSLDARTLLLYDFEPDGPQDIVSLGSVPDISNFNHAGTLESLGNGEYSTVSDVPPHLAPHSTAALNLTETGSGTARLTCAFDAADLNWNDSDWTFCAWVKRNDTATEDFVFHLGAGDGHGPQEELHLSFAAGLQELRLQKINAGGASAGIVKADVRAGEWHHVSVTFDRTAGNTGTLALFVDGFLAGTVPDVVMAVDQSRPAVLGGHAETTEISRGLDGRLDDVMIAGAVLSRAQLRALATMGAAHVLGLSATDDITVNVAGANDAPTLTPPADTGMASAAASASLSFRTGDAESEARTLTVRGTSSHQTLIPDSGIVISSAPPAWSSADIGTTSVPGDTVEDHGTFLIRAGGIGVGGAGDAFRFVSQGLAGDAELICRVVSLESYHAGAGAGLMLRTGTEANAAFAMVGITSSDGVQFSSRSAAGGIGHSTSLNFIAAPVWLRLVRSGSGVAGYFAPEVNGAPAAWQRIAGVAGLTWPAALQAGMAVSSSDAALSATAVVDSVGGHLKTGGERVVTLTPVAGQTGVSTITLSVSDGEMSTAASFLAVVGVNTPPAVSRVPDIDLISGTVPEAFILRVSDLHTPASSLTITATSSDSRLLPDNRITVTGTGEQRHVQLRPVPGETGSAMVTLTVSDGTAATPLTFMLTVHPGDPALLIHAGTNWRYFDTGTAPADWNTRAFQDTAWPVGPAQLGFGDGDESTVLNASPARRTTYFRRSFTLTDPDLYPWLQLRMVRDDGAAVYLNGRELWRTNLPEGLPLTAFTDALLAVEGADEHRSHSFTVRRVPFVAGVNVLAVEVHQKATASHDLSFDLEARALAPSPMEAIPAGAVWSYLDTGEDPGIGWTELLFADSAWRTGAAQLGYGDGDESTVIAAGPENARFVTSYFRRQFAVPGKDEIAGIGLRMLRDDGIQVWLNGQVLHRDNLPPGPTAATLAENTVGSPPESEWQSTWLAPDLLREGINQLAAELHQSSLTTADASFDLQLLLYTHDSLPPLVANASQENITLTWPLWAGAWRVQSSADLNLWTGETAVPVADADGWSLTLPRTERRKYFRLVLP